MNSGNFQLSKTTKEDILHDQKNEGKFFKNNIFKKPHVVI